MKIENGILVKVENSDIQNGQFEIPEGVTSIMATAFVNCSNLTSIVIPEGVTSIGGFAFAYCKHLASIVIPDSVTSIGYHAFRECFDLTTIVIPDSVTYIGNNAFFRCWNLTSIVIPDSVDYLGAGAFSGCIRLNSVTIPRSVTKIGMHVFSGCIALTDIHIEAKTQENYDKIWASLPEKLQEKIQDNQKEFVEKALLLFAGSKQDASFFKQAGMPSEITRALIANLASQYDISPFMLNQAYQKFGIKLEAAKNIEDESSSVGCTLF